MKKNKKVIIDLLVNQQDGGIDNNNVYIVGTGNFMILIG